MSNKEA